MKIFTKKRVVWSIVLLVILLIIGLSVRSRKNAAASAIQTAAVKKQDIALTVLTTGQVTSDVDLNLSFQGGGIVRQILVKEGDAVKAGQILATLDQTTARASLLSAEGALAQANANYERVLAGATNEQITVAQKAVETSQQAVQTAQNNYASVKQQQDTNVANAYRVLLNGGLEAIQVVGPYSSPGVNASSAPLISGLYSGTTEGAYTIVQSGNSFTVNGLETVSTQPIDTRTTFKLGTKGLYVQFPTDQVSATWQVSIPNDKSPSYVLNYNAYQAALAARTSALTAAQGQIDATKTALQQAEAGLAQQRASATPAEVNAAKAQILTAQGQVASAQASVNNLTLRAPSSGTITKIDVKVGELASPSQEMMVLQDINALYAQANVSEANIASLKVGQVVDYTFDALGPDRHFSGKIATINPASTVVSGVVNYKVTASFDNVAEIKPGMTANMTVMVEEKKDVVAVESSALVNQNGKEFIRLIDDPQKKTYHQVEVQTGLEADGGLVEITSGVSEGQQIVTFMK